MKFKTENKTNTTTPVHYQSHRSINMLQK